MNDLHIGVEFGDLWGVTETLSRISLLMRSNRTKGTSPLTNHVMPSWTNAPLGRVVRDSGPESHTGRERDD